MTNYKTNDYSPIKKECFFGNLIGNVGNNNIRSNHIKFFEKQILLSNENRAKDISLAPNYYAWLVLIAEQVFWCLREFAYYHRDLKPGNLALDYRKSISQFIQICREKKFYEEAEIKSLEKNLFRFLVIRHAITHNGFPNLLPIQIKTNPKKFSYEFTIKEIEDMVKFFSNPSNFEKINEKFFKTIKKISILPNFSVDL